MLLPLALTWRPKAVMPSLSPLLAVGRDLPTVYDRSKVVSRRIEINISTAPPTLPLPTDHIPINLDLALGPYPRRPLIEGLGSNIGGYCYIRHVDYCLIKLDHLNLFWLTFVVRFSSLK